VSFLERLGNRAVHACRETLRRRMMGREREVMVR